MGDGTADSTRQSETRVESEAAEFFRRICSYCLFGSVDFGQARRGWRRSVRHGGRGEMRSEVTLINPKRSNGVKAINNCCG